MRKAEGLSTVNRRGWSQKRIAFIDQLEKDDDMGNFTAADERFEPLVVVSTAYNEEAPRPGKRPLERGDFAEKMARQTNPGTLLLVFNFYAKLFAPHQQMTKKVPTYSEIMFANNTLSQGEVMCFCSDFRIVPHLLSRNDVRNIWPFIGEEHGGAHSEVKRVGKELSLEGFQEFLVRVALLNGLTPEGRQNKLCEDKMPHSAINALVKWLHLDDRMAIKHKLATVGKKTQQRLASSSHESSLSNPYTRFDANRFTMLRSLNPQRISIEDMIKAANSKRGATSSRGRRNATTAVTQNVSVVQKAMSKYHHSLKHTFARFDSELVTTSWKKFQRDRATGQICRAYVDCGDVCEGVDYHFTVKLKNQTKTAMCLKSLGLRGDGLDGDQAGTAHEDAEEGGSTVDVEGCMRDQAGQKDHGDIDRQNIIVSLDTNDEAHESGRDGSGGLIFHPGSTRRLSIKVKAIQPCEVFRMLQFRAVVISQKIARRGTAFFDNHSSAALREAIASPLQTRLASTLGTDGNLTIDSLNKKNAAFEIAVSSEAESRAKPASIQHSVGAAVVVNCPLYLRCPSARDFYRQPSRLQQTLHQRMSLPPSAFEDDGNMSTTYDGFDTDKGTFTASTAHPFGGAADNSDAKSDSYSTSRSRRGSRRSGLLGKFTDDGEDDDSEAAMLRRTGFLGDDPAAKAAREKAREMREKLSKTEYMLELEQKTKDCWEGNYQFQRDRSATYRKAPARAAEKARRILLAATRGGKDVATSIPTLDVQLRLLAPTPKMDWKLEEPATLEDNQESFVAGERQYEPARAEDYPPMPVFDMPPVTRFSGLDMRNHKHLYAMLHGSTSSIESKDRSRTGPWNSLHQPLKMGAKRSFSTNGRRRASSRSTLLSRDGRLTRPGTGLSQSSSLPLLGTGRPM